MTPSPDEHARLDALTRSRIVDTQPEPEFDNLARIAANVTDSPMALISFVDRDRVWLKAAHGLQAGALPRIGSFCDIALRHAGVFSVYDAASDGRFAEHPLVSSLPHARAYAGAPIIEEGHALGTVAVLDTKPRVLGQRQLDVLEMLAREVISLLELRRLRDARLLRSEALLASAMRISNIGCWQWNLRSNEITWSEEMYEIFEVPRGEKPDLNVYSARLHPDDRKQVEARMTLAAEGALTNFPDYRIKRSNGEVRVMHATAELERDLDGRPYLLTGAVLDVTDRRLAEESRKKLAVQLMQSQKLESLSVLSAGIAHDFNNLLVGILGNAELAAADLDLTASTRELLEHVTASAIQAAGLTRQLLAYTGRGHLEMLELDLTQQTEATVDLLRSSLPASISLMLSVARDLPGIQADADQLQQIVRSLVVNAAESYGGAVGEVRVRTFTATLTDEVGHDAAHEIVIPAPPAHGTYVVLEVVDHGAGMSRETMERAFEPFYSTKFTGRGLGLAAVLGITRAHRAVLRVESRLGHGTCFRVHFPALERAAPSSNAPQRVSPSSRVPALEGRTVLVIDDEPRVRQLERRVLETYGVRVLEAASGDEAIELLRAHRGPVDAVLLDLVMPGLDAASTLRALRSLRPELPVMIQSGYSQEEVTSRLREMDEELPFLAKPFSPKILVAKLVELLGVPTS